jgi:hypothetical protein
MTKRADTLWRSLKAATCLLVTLVAFFIALGSQALAHDPADSRAAVIPINESPPISHAATDAVAGIAGEIRSGAGRCDFCGCARPCPGGDCGAGCDPCCSVVSGCASCCGAAALTVDPHPIFLPTAASRLDAISVLVGVGEIPTDPPPRLQL